MQEKVSPIPLEVVLERHRDQLLRCYYYLFFKDLYEEITKILTTTNPVKAGNLVKFNYGIGEYEYLPDPGDTVVFYKLDGTLLERGTVEHKEYLQERGIDRKFNDCLKTPSKEKGVV